VLGGSRLGGDVQNRTIGLRRAAERTFDSLEPWEQAQLEAYAEGVNAWLAGNPLPPEYAELELTETPPWTPVDTLAIGKGIAANLSLDIDAGLVERREAFIEAGEQADPPFDGEALLFQDVQRSAPIDPASTVPDATGSVPYLEVAASGFDAPALGRIAAAERRLRDRARHSRLMKLALDRRDSFVGSNHWGVAAEKSEAGVPMIANDPHLSLNWPSTFYENHLVVRDDPERGPMNVSGITFPGVPAVILGQNESIAWGATTNPMDVSDLFRDKLVRGPASGCAATFCIETEGRLEPGNVSVEQYFVNTPGDGQSDNLDPADLSFDQIFVFTVPFRSFGPVVDIDDPSFFLGATTETEALILQYTGFHATGEVRTFLRWARARNLEEFKEGLAFFDAGSQNWAYADAEGNLAYFSSAENPLRKDLEAGAVAGLPPFFVRDGSGPHNWVPDPQRSQGQAIPYAILPFDEMPQAVNPPAGFFANANNDPAGTTLDNDPLNQRRPGNPDAIYYLNPGYDEGFRAGRITRLLREKIDAGDTISLTELRRMQANNQSLDAELLMPFLLRAHANAVAAGAPPELAALAADPRLAEAVERLRNWDFSTFTGIPEGWDWTDKNGFRLPVVPQHEIDASVATTIQNVWRAKLIRNVVDATLRRVGAPGTGSTSALKAVFHLLRQDSFTGVGHSGVDFFPEPAGLAAEQRRDVAILQAMVDALDALAGPDFEPAFAGSTDQDDYRWGLLHRITFDHTLGGERSVPPGAGFEDVSDQLRGFARDGGFEVVNASGFGARSDRWNDFRFGGGPVRRYAGAAGASRVPGASVVGFNQIPGGSSGVAGHPLEASQLPGWLTADQHAVGMFERDALKGATAVEEFRSPAPPE